MLIWRDRVVTPDEIIINPSDVYSLDFAEQAICWTTPGGSYVEQLGINVVDLQYTPFYPSRIDRNTGTVDKCDINLYENDEVMNVYDKTKGVICSSIHGQWVIKTKFGAELVLYDNLDQWVFCSVLPYAGKGE